MKYFERLLWGTIAICLVYISSTDPWWNWWIFGLISLSGIVIGYICYQWGFRDGDVQGRSIGYRIGSTGKRR